MQLKNIYIIAFIVKYWFLKTIFFPENMLFGIQPIIKPVKNDTQFIFRLLSEPYNNIKHI